MICPVGWPHALKEVLIEDFKNDFRKWFFKKFCRAK